MSLCHWEIIISLNVSPLFGMFSNTSDSDVTEYIYLDETGMETGKWNG